MQTFTKLALAVSLAVGLTGCSFVQKQQTPIEQHQAYFMSVVPTFETVEPVFIEAKRIALENPTPENIEAFNYVLGLKRLLSQDMQTGNLGHKHKQVSRGLSLDWGNNQRGGAAMRQPAYVHTLGGSIKTYRPDDYPAPVQVNVPPKHLLGNKPITYSNGLSSHTGEQGLSMYELSRWERYCNEGKGMDKRDWAFVHKEGLDNVPSMLISDCKPPKVIGRVN